MLIALLALAILVLVGVFAVARPTRVLLPMYAIAVPTGSAFELQIPLPPPFNTASSLLGGGLLLATILHLLLYRTGRIPRIGVGVWLVFLGWITLTAFWAVDPGGATNALKIAWPLLLLLFALSLVPTDEVDLDAFRLASIFAGIALGLVALFLLVTGSDLFGDKEGRFIIGTEGDTDPNILAAAVLLPLAISTERIVFGGHRWMSDRMWRAYGGIGMLFSFIAIVLTGSRGGLLAASVTFLLTLAICARLPEGRRIVGRIAATIIAGAVAIYGTLLLAFMFSPEGTVRQILDESPISRIPQTELGTSGRAEIWLTGYTACLTHCAGGAGIGSFPDVFDHIFPFTGAESAVGAQRPAHSIYLSLAVETGFVGLTLFLLSVLLEWSGIRDVQPSDAPAPRTALIGILLANVLLGAIWFKYFWLVFIFVGLVENARHRTHSREIRPPVGDQGRAVALH